MAEEGEGSKKKKRKRGKPGKKGRRRHGGKAELKAREGKARAALGKNKPGGRRRVNLIVAIAHPVRRGILRTLREIGKPVSPAQASKVLDLPLGVVAYHSRVLRKLGAVEPAGEKPSRGAVEHFYDTTIEDDPPIETLLEETREVDEEDKENEKGK